MVRAAGSALASKRRWGCSSVRAAQAAHVLPLPIATSHRAQGDIQGMQDQVRVLAVHAGQNAAEASGSVSRIKELDRVKRNMEAACSTLKEATELSGMFIKVRA